VDAQDLMSCGASIFGDDDDDNNTFYQMVKIPVHNNSLKTIPSNASW
jgi:hypothetical protein